MVAAELLAPPLPALEADFGASDFVSDSLDFGASDFIVSEEEAGGAELEAAGGLELEPGLDGDVCAIADESINPLSAVVINSFCSIVKPPCNCCLAG